MSTLVFFAVGGTGMRTVEPLLHLCALGLGPDRLKLVLIDPDQTHPSAGRALELIALYQEVRNTFPRANETKYFHTDVVVAHEGVWSPISRMRGGAKAMERFSTLVDAPAMRTHSKYLGKLFDLLYDPNDEQEMPLEKGFRGRPSIGTVFMNRIATAPWLRELMADRDAVFFAAGSVFGGTGASGLPVISEVLRADLVGQGGQADVQAVELGRVGAALVLPFFRPTGGETRASDNGIMPDPAIFALNALGAMPYYTALRSGYGEMFVLGEEVWRETGAAVGGPEQDNGPHHVEFFAALAALEFGSNRTSRATSARFWVASASGKNVHFDDLPIPRSQRDQFAGGLIWAHTVLNHFGDSSGMDSFIAERLHGSTWLSELGIRGDQLLDPSMAQALSALCKYASSVWDWAGQISDVTRSPCVLMREGAARSAKDTPFAEILASRSSARKSITPTVRGMEIFRGWNTAAALSAHRKGGPPKLLEVMRLGSEDAVNRFFAQVEPPEAGQRRTLLPSLRENNIQPSEDGSWNDITAHRHNLKRIKSQEDAKGANVRIGSIPSPWARMLLYEDALTDAQHPARRGITLELLDALEFTWRAGARPPDTTLEMFQVQDLHRDADSTGSPGASEFAAALERMYKWPNQTAGQAAPPISLVLVPDGLAGHQAIAASSPFTMLFAGASHCPGLAPFAHGLFGSGSPRELHERDTDFQVYVTSILRVPNELAEWQEELKRLCVRAGMSLSPAQIEELRQRCEEHQLQFSGFTLLHQNATQPMPSKWRLHHAAIGFQSRQGPYIVDPQTFDGRFFVGAPEVQLPPESQLATLAGRDHLPGSATPGQWASPRHHWFTERLVLLENPIRGVGTSEPGAIGYKQFRSELPTTSDLLQSRPRFLLPLTREVFQYFAPQQIDDMLTITVRGNGDVDVRLTLELEDPADLQRTTSRVFNRLYLAAEIVQASRELGSGSDIAIWPAFEAEDWNEYLILRSDVGAFADNVEVRLFDSKAMVPIQPETALRTGGLSISAVKVPPRILSFVRRLTTGKEEEVGILLPRFAKVPVKDLPWTVAVDFGTSNTTVTRRNMVDQVVVVELGAVTSMLMESVRLPGLIEAYFMPILEGQPRRLNFGTALVTHNDHSLPSTPSSTPGVLANIPWGGVLRDDQKHKVFGDLKWVGADDAGGRGRTAAFLRQLIAAIAASARMEGVKAVSIHWSFPGAYSVSQAQGVEGLWKTAAAMAINNGVAPRYPGVTVEPFNPALHESACTLEYFTLNQRVSTGRGVLAVFDVGGGTTDIALYSDDKPILYDSVLLGGRNLTGGGFDGSTNPFVDRLLSAVRAHTREGNPLFEVLQQADVYRRNGQDHLAFSHLVSSPAFQLEQGIFTALEEIQPFRALVLYFYGALFYHAGLALRGLQVQQGSPFKGALKVAIAGNGSRYLKWAGLRHDSGEFFAFTKACFLAGGAGAMCPVEEEMFQLAPQDFAVLTDHPKEEVAKGMLQVIRKPFGIGGATSLTPTIGEAVRLPLGDLTEVSTLGTALKSSDISALQFIGEKLQVEQFNIAWHTAAGALFRGDSVFVRTVDGFVGHLQSLGRQTTEERVRRRLNGTIAKFGEWRGSLFLVQVEAMMQELVAFGFGGKK